jgi:ankyrin repeat protein
LGAAAAAGRTDAVKLLLARGAYLENRTLISLDTPLIEAAQTNHTDIVILLLEHGADMQARDVMGFTALDWARKIGK